MANQADFDAKYNQRYPKTWQFERSDDGILLIRHKQHEVADRALRTPSDGTVRVGNPDGPTMGRAQEIWELVGTDYANKIAILTGHDKVFFNSHPSSFPAGFFTAHQWHSTVHQLPRSMQAFLDMPMPLIGAANGEATVHAEYLVMCDIVVAGESAVFQDMPHVLMNTVPGDGVSIVWQLLLGPNRGRHFLLTGRKITAHEALELGIVSEVVPDDQLLPRCYEIARELLRQDELTLRLTAPVLRQQLKVQVQTYLQHSLGLEGLVFMEQSYQALLKDAD